ncbi:MAG: hypothetical protein Q3994_00025 [Prevotella sp.]|nr:hypothetical protein [Prevotella sp.]
MIKDTKIIDKLIYWYGSLSGFQLAVVFFKSDLFSLFLVMNAIYLATLLIVLIFRIKEKKGEIVKFYIAIIMFIIITTIGQYLVKIQDESL